MCSVIRKSLREALKGQKGQGMKIIDEIKAAMAAITQEEIEEVGAALKDGSDGKVFHSLGRMSDEAIRLFCVGSSLRKEWERTQDGLPRGLRFIDQKSLPEEKFAEIARAQESVEIADKLFWALVKDEFPLAWRKESIGFRRGWEFGWFEIEQAAGKVCPSCHKVHGEGADPLDGILATLLGGFTPPGGGFFHGSNGGGMPPTFGRGGSA